jgi:hypothetical protein
MVQLASGTEAIYWVQPLKGHFFASFTYGNHAAPYFVLAGALTAGLLYNEVLDARLAEANGGRARLRRRCGSGCCLPAAAVPAGALLGFSRTGIILTGGLVICLAGYGLVRAG